VIVVDASIVAVALGDDGSDGQRLRARLRGERLLAPQLMDLEVLSVWRRLVSVQAMTPRRARLAVDDLAAIPVERAPHDILTRRCWELRHDLTAYDAAYVALAEILEITLVTADRRMANAPGLRCDVEVI
jgi:predicted nucleic acid-binding protein